MSKYQQGVTLVELLIAVIIISILMSVAVPSYRDYVMRARRAEGQAVLLHAAAAQEKFYLQQRTYANNAQLAAAPPAGLGLQNVTESGDYQIAIANADATSFSIVATALQGQTADEDCDVFAIDERGRRYAGPGPAFGANNDLDDCW